MAAEIIEGIYTQPVIKPGAGGANPFAELDIGVGIQGSFLPSSESRQPGFQGYAGLIFQFFAIKIKITGG